jgi:putative transposase
VLSCAACRIIVARSSRAGAVNLLERRKTLLIDYIATLREAVATTREDHPFTIDAFVVLPDHRHAIWSLPLGDSDFSTRWRLIKSRFARARAGMFPEDWAGERSGC